MLIVLYHRSGIAHPIYGLVIIPVATLVPLTTPLPSMRLVQVQTLTGYSVDGNLLGATQHTPSMHALSLFTNTLPPLTHPMPFSTSSSLVSVFVQSTAWVHSKVDGNLSVVFIF